MTSSTIAAVLAGFGTGLSLIVAIGAQNAFVLRQGARRQAVLAVVAVCAVSDAVLIALGVAGVGAFVTAWPAALTAVALTGGGFLLCYGFLAARRVLRPDPAAALTAGGPDTGSARRAVLTCLALTWLNPHVYLDTVLLLGSLASDRGDLRWAFGAGAALSSLTWFFALGFGARLLSRALSRPKAWRVLDGLVAATMLAMGGMLVAGA
ncbi:LysE/ArgO family amino acid transporter [Streptomyces sp. NPDC086023]|uniref:LysE/ArgO family amino acid transporter n=1 Tax=Streptomyces sp. NPDC086023 TaxID=3365746 RepID=UPI0037CCCB5A